MQLLTRRAMPEKYHQYLTNTKKPKELNQESHPNERTSTHINQWAGHVHISEESDLTFYS